MDAEIERFFLETTETNLAQHHVKLKQMLTTHVRQHGRMNEWSQVLDTVEPEATEPSFDTDTICVGPTDTDYSTQLRALVPWRKGPLMIGDTFIDTEWRSDWKWQRVQPHLIDLHGKNVLDIGCGNGYHIFRMLGNGARLALGVDPTVLFNFQFALMQKLTSKNNAYLLPLRSEHLPAFGIFDVVFSMGVLYHRRSPLDHLQELFSFLRPGGQLVLETLIVQGNNHEILIPEDRYAKMANVWFIPSTFALETMVHQVGFQDSRAVDVTVTTIHEQRSTQWMEFESLVDFLDPDDTSKTIEGYPAPCRAILIARKPT